MAKFPAIDELLAPGGTVSQLLRGYEARPQQLQMARAVARALKEKKIALIEAGTGTGKSFGYLFAVVLEALASEEPAVISSSTHVLQDQLIKKDIPFVQRALGQHGIEFAAAEVKGMGAYVCLLALEEQGASLGFDFPGAIPKLEEWAKTAAEGTRSEAPGVPAGLWEQVRADRDTCTGAECRHYERCFFFQSRRRAQEAQILVANHSLVFADLAVKEEGGRVLPAYSVLVLDEAQNVEHAATEFLGSNISPRGLKILLHRLRGERGGGALAQIEGALYESKLPKQEQRALADFLRNQIDPELKRAEEAITAGFDRIEEAYAALAPPADGKGRRALRLTAELLQRPAFTQAHAAAHHMAGSLGLAANRVAQYLQRVEPAENLLSTRDYVMARSACRSLRERAQDLKDFFDPVTAGEGETVKWLEPETTKKGFQIKLASAPLDVAPHLEQRLLKKLDCCALTSATLAVGREFDYARQRLGLAGELAPRVETLLLDSPFNFQQNVLIGIPLDLPDPADSRPGVATNGGGKGDFLHEAARFIWRALKVSRGRSLVLFHSWYALRETHRLIAPHAEKLGFRVLCQGEAGLSKNRLIEIFRQDVHSVLLATTSYREGIDVPGESLSNLILHRLPFGVPDEPVPQARMERIEQNGGNSFRDYELPAAAIAFKQAFGRLIRAHTDYGIFLCLDKRLATKRYGARFLEALPPCEIVRGTKEKVLARAAEFLRRQDVRG